MLHSLLNATVAATAVASGPHAGMDPRALQDDVILCPFVRIADPDTSSQAAFIGSLTAQGASLAYATAVALDITQKQKGIGAVLVGEAPDPFRLDEVPGRSHPDLYQAFPEETTQFLTERSVNGMVTVQDLVDAKLMIADIVGVVPNEASEAETFAAFVFAGGDLDTDTIDLVDVLTFIVDGEKPANTGRPTAVTQTRAQRLGKF